jgi:hypothetical protein
MVFTNIYLAIRAVAHLIPFMEEERLKNQLASGVSSDADMYNGTIGKYL